MKKKTVAILLVLIYLLSTSTLHAQVCNWIKQSNANLDELTVESVTDAIGNTYLVGSFDGLLLNFGSTTLVNPAMTVINPSAFLVKYDHSGNIVWAKLLGGGLYNAANSITMDAAGKLYVYGNFYNPTVTFGSFTLTNASGYDNFLVKLDTSGNVMWAKAEHESTATGGQAYALGVVADKSGHILVTGSYDSSITIGGIHVAAFAGHGGVYLAKYDTSGNVLWAKTSAGTDASLVNSIAIDNSDNIYIAGYSYSPSISFDGITLSNIGGMDLFVVKYNSGGIAQWAHSIIDSCNSSINDIDIDAAGNIYLAGLFSCPNIIIGPYTLTNLAYGSANPNGFVAQYSSSGSANWAKSLGGISGDGALAVDVSPLGYVVVGGINLSAPSFIGHDTLHTPGSFLAGYNTAGAVLWLKSMIDSSGAFNNSLSHDAAGNLYVSGYFKSTLTCNGHSVTDTSTTGNSEIFTASFVIPPNSMPEEPELLSLAIYPNPASTQLSITSNSAQITNVIITNLLGQVVNSTICNTSQLQINIASFAPGVYLIRINGAVVKKFVKE